MNRGGNIWIVRGSTGYGYNPDNEMQDEKALLDKYIDIKQIQYV